MEITDKSPNATREFLLQKSKKLIDEFEYSAALKFLSRVQEIDGEDIDIEVWETIGSLQIDVGLMDSAKKTLNKVLSIQPRPSIYFQLAQLAEGKEAVDLIKNGISLLEVEINKNPKDNNNNLILELSNAYCSLVEIYMTDCCFDSDAENLCKRYAELAIKSCDKNAEALQTMASLLITQGKTVEASEFLYKSLQLWLPEEFIANSSNDNLIADKNDILPMPCYSSRLSLAKMLIEIKLYRLALMVLKTLQQENDESFEVWYLSGLASWLEGCELLLTMSEFDFDPNDASSEESALQTLLDSIIDKSVKVPNDCLEIWAYAAESIEECKRLHEKQIKSGNFDVDPEMLEKTQELYSTIDAVLSSADNCEVSEFR